MMMIITPDDTFGSDSRNYLPELGSEVSIPAHWQDVIRLVQQEQVPKVIVLNLSILEPHGPNILQSPRGHGYAGKIIIKSETLNRPVLADVHHHHMDRVMRKSPQHLSRS